MGLSVLHPGLAYGGGTASEDLTSGMIAKLTGADLFGKVAGAADKAFGVVYRDAKLGEYATVYCDGGVYETDTFISGIAAGDELEVDPATALLRKATTGEVVAQAMAVSATELKFKLKI